MPEVLASRRNNGMHSPCCWKVWLKRHVFRKIVEDHETRQISAIQSPPELGDLFPFLSSCIDLDTRCGAYLRDNCNDAELGLHPVHTAGVGGAEPVSIFDRKLCF